MKRTVLTFLLSLALLTPAARAAGAEGLRAAMIDTGISPAAVEPARIAAGRNYIRPQEDTNDRLGHGTAVAALIAEGCPSAVLVPLVYGTADETGREIRGGSDMTAQIIRDAVDVYGCRIVNLSGGSRTDSAALHDAVRYAAAKGALIVTSAGNSGLTAPDAVYYPGGYAETLCVGAANADGGIAAFSQRNDTVDLLAQGTALRLTAIDGTTVSGEGTSFAAAIVTGTAAQLWTLHPDWTAAQVRAALLTSARTADGFRVLDASAALAVTDAPAALLLTARETLLRAFGQTAMTLTVCAAQ